MRRHDVPRLAACDPMTGEVIRASKTTAVRYERTRPGELIHMDVKKIGRIPDGGGWRAHGREMGSSWAAGKTRIGYDYVHSVVDDHSRFAYCEILADEQGHDTARSSHARSPIRSPRHHRHALMTDNAWNYTHSNALRDAPRPTPASNTSASNRTAHGKTAKSNGSTGHSKPNGHTDTVFATNDERSAALAPWLEDLQHSPPPQRTRRPTPDQPTVTNLMAGYS